MNPEVQRARTLRTAIRKVLNEWDPLDVAVAGPQDEYDSLIVPIWQLLCARAPRQRIVEILAELEFQFESVSSFEMLNLVADKLVRLPNDP